MQIEIKIDSTATEPRIMIITNAVTEEVAELAKRLSCDSLQMVVGFQNTKAVVLEDVEIIRIYAADGKVYATTREGDYQLRLRLYEVEMRLDKRRFVRISNSEIINLKQVKGFDLSLTGTICVSLSNGATTYVSRRYVSKIKSVLL